MKRVLLVAVMVLSLLVSSIALAADANMVFVKTDKTMYLMDPWLWVYRASNYIPLPGPGWDNAGLWPKGGYPRDINFTVKTYDATGKIKDLGSLSYMVLDDASVLKNGPVAATVDPGVYSGSFQLMDADIGGSLFTGQQPKQLTLRILNSVNQVVKEQSVHVGRWGCDRCHIGKYYGKEAWVLPDDKTIKVLFSEIYPWCEPTGYIGGPHDWYAILGRNGQPGARPFDLRTLNDSTLVHTPPDYQESHELTWTRWAGNYKCTPCHTGVNRIPDPPDYVIPAGVPDLRPVWDASGYYNWIPGIPPTKHAKSEAVECTFCHGMEGGYIPAGGSWADNAGFITAGHGHKDVPALSNDLGDPDSRSIPWYARQNCANIACHGHINTTKDERIDNAKPDCRLCHGIHNLNPY